MKLLLKNIIQNVEIQNHKIIKLTCNLSALEAPVHKNKIFLALFTKGNVTVTYIKSINK